jgi:hypothetical protein
MPNTPNITTGIKAIKVAKTDALGNNQTLQLQEADILRINFDDLGTLNFTVVSISEYNTYYLYYVVPTSLGNDLSYFSNPILPKNVSGSNTDSIFISGSNPVGVFRSYQSKTGVSGSLIEGSGNFALNAVAIEPYTIQVTCSFNIKFSVDPFFTGAPIIAMMSGSYTDPDIPRTYRTILGASYVGLQTRTTSSFYPVTCSFTVNPGYIWNNDSLQGLNDYFGEKPPTKISPVYNSQFGLYFQNPYSGTNYQFIIQTGSINVTLNQLHTSSNDINGNLTVIEPYYTANYQTSEYNAIINNAVVSREDTFYMDVDFSGDAIIAVNEQSILNGSATRAAVQSSNYTTARVINPRYNGCRTEASTGSIFENFVNQPMTTGSTIGLVPNVEEYCNWFAYYSSISPTYAVSPWYDLYGGAFEVQGALITTLIDINGNVINLSPQNNQPLISTGEINPNTSNIGIVESIFPPGATVYIQQFNNTSGSLSTTSGSFTSTNVYFPAIYYQPSLIGAPNTIVQDETSLLLFTGSASPYLIPTTNTPGLIMPQNFNPKYKQSILQIAQSVGFFKTL